MRLVLLSAAIFITCLTSSAQNSREEAYIKRYKDIAISNMEEYGIPASITLAQASLESGFGTSRLATEGNNHFGIKCHDWKGSSIRYDDDLKGECFRKYSKPQDSFKDHAHFLRYRTRYQPLFDLDIKDYKGWAHGLKSAGYATNPNYAKLLIGIIERYSLYKYDLQAHHLPETPSEILAIKEFIPSQESNLHQIKLSRPLFKKNGVISIIASANDSYSSIAREFNLFRKELLKFNDLKGESTLSQGEVVYLERKKRRGDSAIPKHIASGSESLREISQIYGIRLNSLLKLNKIDRDSTPIEGTTIKLIK